MGKGKRKSKRMIFFWVASLLVTPLWASEWRLAKPPEPMGVELAAQTTNLRGDGLWVWKKVVGKRIELYAELQLGRRHSFSNRVPSYQIDQGRIVALDRILVAPEGAVEGWVSLTDKTATWKLFEGEGKPVVEGDALFDWVNRDRLRFIYFDTEKGEHTTEFMLTGLRKAVAALPGLAIPGVAPGLKKAR